MERVDILQSNYEEKNSIVSKCEDVILEAKRVILNEQLDKIANVTLSEVNHSRNIIEKCLKQCKESLNWKNEEFWQDLPPNPKSLIGTVKSNNADTEKNISHNKIVNVNNHFIEVVSDDLIKINNNEIRNTKSEKESHVTKKYFLLWKELVKLKREKKVLLENKHNQQEKLEKFVKEVKKIKMLENKCDKKEVLPKNSYHESLSSPHIYKNRYTAQKTIINMQKAKLTEQNKLIEELKLGIIKEDLLKSIENTKVNIREIFSKCSSNVKCKVPIIFIQETNQFKINTQQAPKIVQQMEQRALERVQRRDMILERKRLIEEERQRLLEEAIENKRVLEEEERRKNLEIIKERRKKELEVEKIRQAKKRKYLENLNKAVNFHNKMLKVKCFKQLYDNFRKNRGNTLFAKEYYETKILKKCMYCWYDFVEDTYKEKYEIADAHFTYILLKRTFKTWHDVHIENKRNMQVAEDLYDFHLTGKTFIHWHRYVCVQIMLEDKRLKIARNHYLRKILFHYFYLWRSLPAVMQLEKAKELRKRKWREKVWEILPDYKPPRDE